MVFKIDITFFKCVKGVGINTFNTGSFLIKFIFMKKVAIFITLVLAILNNLSAFSQENKTDNVNNLAISKKLIIYGSDTCHYCLDTKSFLKNNNIEFIYYDVDVNIDKQNEMIMKLKSAKISISNLNLPVVDKKGDIFTNNMKFDEFLNKIIE